MIIRVNDAVVMFCLMLECVMNETSIAVVFFSQVLNDCNLLMHGVFGVKQYVQRGTLVQKAVSFTIELQDDRKLESMSAVYAW